jgi:hypothetical protein
MDLKKDWTQRSNMSNSSPTGLQNNDIKIPNNPKEWIYEK